MITTTTKSVCRNLAALLSAHGVRRAVVSPGSRNAPLIVALNRQPDIALTEVVDERSAAFVALGMAARSGEPVAVCCTSGSALLNYAPALAEAFYRHVPLIAVSADRPSEWIDQADSQTMRQCGALSSVTKKCVDIADDASEVVSDRLVNEAVLSALQEPRGPVHINVQLAPPLGQTEEAEVGPRVIRMMEPRGDLRYEQVRALGEELNGRRILIVAGGCAPSSRLHRALGRMASMPDVVVVGEPTSNLHVRGLVGDVDSLLASVTDDVAVSFYPDVVVSFGLPVVSARLKNWLRAAPDSMEHWALGYDSLTADTFRHLTMRINTDPAVFLSQLAGALKSGATNYRDSVAGAYLTAVGRRNDLLGRMPWSDFMAVGRLLYLAARKGWDVELSNGMTVRYAALFDNSGIHRMSANRGISGIEGSTSTAVGAALTSQHPTLLITGDTSAFYDIAGLASTDLPSGFRIAIIDNGGGNIFRIVANTRSLDERERFLTCHKPVGVSWADVARSYRLDFFEASSFVEFDSVAADFSASGRPAMLVVHTDGPESAKLYQQYFNNLKQ